MVCTNPLSPPLSLWGGHNALGGPWWFQILGGTQNSAARKTKSDMTVLKLQNVRIWETLCASKREPEVSTSPETSSSCRSRLKDRLFQ
ncbi:hypothetical protein FKM82_003734 [Ascaphus truei]